MAVVYSIIVGTVLLFLVVGIGLTKLLNLEKNRIEKEAKFKRKVEEAIRTNPSIIIHPNFVNFVDDAACHVDSGTLERFLSNIAREKPLHFSPSQLVAFTHNFSKVLGSGGFGVVYKGEFPSGIQIAVKVLNNSSSKKASEQFMAEVGTIGLTYHKNLVRLYGFCSHNNMRALVYEFMEFGSLDKILFSEAEIQVEWGKLFDIAIGIARGLAYLHEECQKRIIHYDIKPGNVLLDMNLTPKLADFGLAKLCGDNTNVELSGYRGTPGYAAPEMWAPYPVTHRCDVYSFGMLLFEIVGRRKNHDTKFSGCSQEWLPRWAYDKFNRDQLLDMFTTCGIEEDRDRKKAEHMVKVALWCVQYLPKARPVMSHVINMLEGGVEIDTPPNPFEHLQDTTLEIESGDYSFGSTSNGNNTDECLLPPLDCNLSMQPTNHEILVSIDKQERGPNTL